MKCLDLNRAKKLILSILKLSKLLKSVATKKSIQTKKISEEENTAFIKDRWKAYQERVIQKNKEQLAISSNPIADGQGETSSSWDPLTVGTGFLQDAGYTTRKMVIILEIGKIC